MGDNSPKFIVVLVTVGSEAEGAKIASTLVEENLAACVKRWPVSSTYRWQGEIQCDREYQLMIKTQQNCFDAIEARIKSIHRYEIPEMIVLPILQGHLPYLTWLEQETTRRVES